MFAAYEGPATDDYDGFNPAIGGNTNVWSPGPVNIYLEVMRDVAATMAGSVSATKLGERAVVHEILHRFGHEDHDVAIMSYALFWTGTDAQVALVGALLHDLRSHNPF